MHFSTLAAIIGSLSALALATPAPHLPAAARAAPVISVCNNADYVDCMDIEVVLDDCQDLYDPWNDVISSFKILAPEIRACAFYKDHGCGASPSIVAPYITEVADVWVYPGDFNDQISAYICASGAGPQ
ncbi:hypothetical protein VF21_07655 [Pseudogymnoascus sp. 05NY08]|nr:hypothetical protein VF21_07655 [Pseudogymnoascus sp. 05NY08]